MKLRSVEIFCASGGLAEGFRRVGVEFDIAVDSDLNACDSYERNLGHRPIRIDARDLLRLHKAFDFPPGALDLVVADPPCTPWSRAGKRLGLKDSRDQLATTAELLKLWRPTCWLVGNVPGADDGPNAEALQSTLGSVPGYCVDYASLDAAAYGVPQHRVRPFWFAHPRGTPCIRWPAATHGPVGRQQQLGGFELLPYVTVRDALSHLSLRELGRPIRIRRGRTRNAHPPSVPDRPSMTICAAQASNGSAVLLTNSKHPINEHDQPSYTITTKGDCRGAQGACVMRWPWDRPGTTVGTRPEMSQAKRSGRAGQSQSANAIKLSERAGALLQGFPDNWVFSGKTKASRWSQIGQAMPPALGEVIAERVVEWFQSQRGRRTG